MNYRYILQRTWGDPKDLVMYLMLNPSTATEIENDPTVERCQRRALSMGYGSFVVTNLFALRSTDPKALYESNSPIGEYNDKYILEYADKARMVICAWGNHGNYMRRGSEVVDKLSKLYSEKLHCLKITKIGNPYHPLYVSYKTTPIPFL
jgi:hypothetical protein